MSFEELPPLIKKYGRYEYDRKGNEVRTVIPRGSMMDSETFLERRKILSGLSEFDYEFMVECREYGTEARKKHSTEVRKRLGIYCPQCNLRFRCWTSSSVAKRGVV